MPEGKCPGDHPCENGTRAPQPKSRPASTTSKWSLANMWGKVAKQGSTSGAKQLADRKDQTAKLKNE
jgi:hypothetical protein